MLYSIRREFSMLVKCICCFNPSVRVNTDAFQTQFNDDESCSRSSIVDTLLFHCQLVGKSMMDSKLSAMLISTNSF